MEKMGAANLTILVSKVKEIVIEIPNAKAIFIVDFLIVQETVNLGGLIIIVAQV